ncbi:MAG: hypothetical protein E6370_15035 [Clostridiales bacterium]|jgi:hypothetical protein|nr:hypothetical protein [Clostridiales bacterium]MDU6975621.1 hypothetical protein [Clostridiales bacterium]
MKKIFALVLTGIALMSSCIYASNIETAQGIQLVENENAFRGVLHTAYNISVDNSTYTSSNFETPSSNSNDINVSFTNDGSSSVTVKLYKVGMFSDKLIGSFDVSAGSSDYDTFSGSSKTTYYVVITNSTGDSIKGSLKVRQLDQ